MSVFTPVTHSQDDRRPDTNVSSFQFNPCQPLRLRQFTGYTTRSRKLQRVVVTVRRRRGPCYLRLRAGRRGVRSPDGGKRFASRPKRPDQLRSPPILGFLWGCIGLGDSRPTTRHHLALKFAMRASVLQSPPVQLYLIDGQQACAFVRTKLLPA